MSLSIYVYTSIYVLHVCMNICIEFGYDGIIVKSKKKEKEKKYRRKERRLGRRDEGREQEEIKRRKREVKNVTCEGHLETDVTFLQFKYFCNSG